MLSLEETPWTFKEWLNECLKRMQFHRKQSTIINYRGRLSKWLPQSFMDKDIKSFTKNDIFNLIFVKLNNQMSENSQKSLLKMIRRIFEMAVEEGIIISNPTRGLVVKIPQREQKVLTATEAETFLKVAQTTSHRFYPVWVVALMTGMRSGEMYALKWSDVDLESNTISVTKQWTSKDGFEPTKTRESRVVPISLELRTFLAELKLKNLSLDSDFVLPHLKEWTNGEQAQVTKEFCRSLGISEIKFHDLRATFITNLLTQGVPLVTVMAIVGHRKISTTDVYLRLAGVNVKGATNQLGYKVPSNPMGQILSFKQR